VRSRSCCGKVPRDRFKLLVLLPGHQRLRRVVKVLYQAFTVGPSTTITGKWRGTISVVADRTPNRALVLLRHFRSQDRDAEAGAYLPPTLSLALAVILHVYTHVIEPLLVPAPLLRRQHLRLD